MYTRAQYIVKGKKTKIILIEYNGNFKLFLSLMNFYPLFEHSRELYFFTLTHVNKYKNKWELIHFQIEHVTKLFT